MGLRLKFNLILAGTLLASLLACSLVVQQMAEQSALAQLEKQIDVLRSQALAVRRYTSDDVRPLLADQSDVQFLPQIVPSFAAQTTFAHFRTQFPQFSYKEAALNPTNPTDLANDWEREIIGRLRADTSLERVVEIRSTAAGVQYTVAFPLTVNSESCLTCHSTPERAPPSMVAVYGDKNGFGWRLNEIIGAQIISVPMAVARDLSWETTKIAVASVGVIFLLLMVLLNILLSRVIISPVTKMAEIAEAVSMGDNSQPEYTVKGSDEIASLAQSFNRMRRSLDNAMKMLES